MADPHADPRTALQATCVAIDGRAVLITGAPGTGKSGLALMLIDRGAHLVGDDSVMLDVRDGMLIAAPHPRTRGLLEVRNLGLLPFACIDDVPVALSIHLDVAAPRFIEAPEEHTLLGITLPRVRLWPEPALLPRKVELALERYGTHPPQVRE